MLVIFFCSFRSLGSIYIVLLSNRRIFQMGWICQVLHVKQWHQATGSSLSIVYTSLDFSCHRCSTTMTICLIFCLYGTGGSTWATVILVERLMYPLGPPSMWHQHTSSIPIIVRFLDNCSLLVLRLQIIKPLRLLVNIALLGCRAVESRNARSTKCVYTPWHSIGPYSSTTLTKCWFFVFMLLAI